MSTYNEPVPTVATIAPPSYTTNMKTLIEQAFEVACRARDNAYAPYSTFQVGAALKARGDERIFGGCNVENLSSGATICAERTALGAMVAAIGKPTLEMIIVVTSTRPATVPCGICLQMLSEFCSADCPVHLAHLDGVERTLRFDELLPCPFVEWH